MHTLPFYRFRPHITTSLSSPAQSVRHSLFQGRLGSLPRGANPLARLGGCTAQGWLFFKNLTTCYSSTWYGPTTR
eukprot:1038434-Ditylum_brightwellii.AAC.1